MALTDGDRKLIAAFRDAFERKYAADPRFSGVVREDRPDETYLTSRFAVADRVWLEMTIRPLIPQVRAGVVTDDRWRNEDLEERIEETGDTMSEFVELGFDEAGLEWPDPPVEHFREAGKYFCFLTPFEIDSLAELNGAAGERLTRVFEGYYEAFRGAIEKMKVAAE